MANKGDIISLEIQPALCEAWKTLEFEHSLEKSGLFVKLKSSDFLKNGKHPVIDQGEKFISGYVDEESLLYQGSLPVIIFGDHTRVLKFVDFKFAVGADGTKILRPSKEFEPKFFFYYLKSLKIPSFGYSRHYSVLKAIEVPLPPLAEQTRIVAKLDAAFAHLETLKQSLERIPELLKKFRQTVLSHAVTGKLTEDWRVGNAISSLPWKNTLLKNIGYVSGGITLNGRRQELPLQVDYLRVANIYANELRLDEIKKIGVTQSEYDKTLLMPNDLLIVEGNGSVDQIGRVALWDGSISPCLHQNHLIRVRVGNTSNAKYILYFLLSPLGRNVIKEASSSTTGLHTLNISKIGNLEIPLPSLAEQQEIVARVEALLARADALEARYEALKALIDKLPGALLAKAFRGELVPQDPTGVPAPSAPQPLAVAPARRGPGQQQAFDF